MTGHSSFVPSAVIADAKLDQGVFIYRKVELG